MVINRVVKKIAQENNLSDLKEFYRSNRFSLWEAKKEKDIVVLKLLIIDDARTRKAFEKDILFHQWVSTEPKHPLKLYLRRFIAQGVYQERRWFLVEKVMGETRRNGYLFPEIFFVEKTIDRLVEFLTALHQFTQVPEFLAKRISGYSLEDFERAINWQDLDESLLTAGDKVGIAKLLDRLRNTFGKEQVVLTHHEVYPANLIIKPDGWPVFLDWENLGWDNPAYDLAIFWLRAYNYPSWRRKLIQSFLGRSQHKEQALKMLPLEVVLQGCGNLRFLSQMPAKAADREEVRQAITFQKRAIQQAIIDPTSLLGF